MGLQLVSDVEEIVPYILFIRNRQVMLDFILAKFYAVENRILIQAVKRNINRFPEDFMFQLTKDEVESLRSQIVISNFLHNKARGGRRYLPYAFTEQGVAMLSSVLRSERAIKVNIEIMHTFMNLRRLLKSHEQLSKKLQLLEKKYDKKFAIVFEAIHAMMRAEEQDGDPIGFKP